MALKVNLNQTALALFCFFLLAPSLPARSAIAMLFIALQVAVFIHKKPRWRKHGIWLPILQCLPIAFIALSLLYSTDLTRGGKYIERSLLVFVLPWLLYANRSLFSLKLQRQTLFIFALVSTAMVGIVLVKMLLTGKFFVALQLPNAYFHIRKFLEAASGFHPTYFSIAVAIAFFTLLALVLGKNQNRIVKFTGFFALPLLAVGLLLASSKMVLFSTFLGSLVIWGHNKPLKTIVLRLSAGLAIVIVLGYFVKPLKQRGIEFIEAITQSDIEYSNPDSARKGIYKSAWASVTESWLWGTGIGDVQSTLNNKYVAFNYTQAAQRQFNTHNYYLHIWLAAGLLPALIFLVLQLAHLGIAISTGNYLHLAITILFSLCMLTENILSRQDGIFLYAFFSSFLAYTSWAGAHKKWFINGRCLSQANGGVQRFAAEVVSHVLPTKTTNGNLLLPKRALSPTTELTTLTLPFFKNSLWEQITLPVYLRLRGCPRLLNLGNSAPLFYANNYITLHDVAFAQNPSWFSREFSLWYNFLIPRILSKARHIFTVSQFSKQEIIRHFNTAKHKITVVPNGVPQYLKSAKAKNEPAEVSKPYALCVGTISPRKNQSHIISLFLNHADLPLTLVLAGGYNRAVFGQTILNLEAIEKAPNILWYKSPSDAQLANLYYHSKFCIYTPYYEGFGIPVLEALWCKKPIIVSDIPVFRELFDGLVLFLELDNNAQLHQLIEEIIYHKDEALNRITILNTIEKVFSYGGAAKKIISKIESSL